VPLHVDYHIINWDFFQREKEVNGSCYGGWGLVLNHSGMNKLVLRWQSHRWWMGCKSCAYAALRVDAIIIAVML